MPEPTPTLTSEGPGEPLVYRSISGFAVASVVVAGLYVLLIALSAAVALIKGEPFYLPEWLLLLPLAGGALALLAHRQIKNSEDTRAGTNLAKWGLWLSLLSGLGYVTYSVVTRLAVQEQANRFLTEKGPDAGFFPLLCSRNESDLLAAFLLTQSVVERRGHKPSDRSKLEVFDTPRGPESLRGQLTLFLESPLVRALQQPHAKPPTIEALGLKEWSYEGKGYRVERNYRITTDEGEYDVLFAMHSADTEAGERKWRVLWPLHSVTAIKLSPQGAKMVELRRQAFHFGNQWKEKLGKSSFLEAYLDTREPSERQKLRELFETGTKHSPALAAAAACAAQALAQGGPVWALSYTPSPSAHEIAARWLPDYQAFQETTSYLKVDDVRASDAKVAALGRQALTHFFAGRLGPPTFHLRQEVVDFSLCSAPKDGIIEIKLDLDQQLAIILGRTPTVVTVTGKLVVAIPESADPARPNLHEQFRVLRLECERILVPPPATKG